MTISHNAENKTWVIVADTSHARLLTAGAVPLNRCHVDEIDRLQNTWVGHEHGRPTMLGGRSNHGHPSRGHETEEEHLRFARAVVDWLRGQVEKHAIENITLFAGPPFLGPLRKACTASATYKCHVHNANLAGLSAADLAAHPLVLERVGLVAH